MKPSNFESVLGPLFVAFVALKRACGAGYETQARVLGQLDKFLVARRCRRVSKDVVDDFVATTEGLASRSRENICCVAWSALEHARRHGGPVGPLPCRPTFPHEPSRKPYVMTEDEIDCLLEAALTPMALARDALCAHTYATLLGLLYTTGMRVGEALALDVNDVDTTTCVLTVRAGKFHKARLLPVKQSTVDGLQRYLRRRRQLGHPWTPGDPLFVSGRGRVRLSIQAIEAAFRPIVERAGIHGVGGRRPRIHDLRHTFAVRRVIAWHDAELDVNHLLALLSTYMGHVCVASTQVYLQPTLPLLRAAAARFERRCAPNRGRRGRKAGI